MVHAVTIASPNISNFRSPTCQTIMPTTTTLDEYDVEWGYHPSIPPLDVRLGLTAGGKRSKSSPPLCWGILSCGKVAHDFCQALKCVEPYHEIVAVSSRCNLERARLFAGTHSIPVYYSSAKELCQDDRVDIIYVASLHPQHREHAELALNAGKHVLVEKPMAMTAKDAEAIYDLGKKRNLFVGEGMWTRFFPAVEWARRELPSIGNPCRVIRADFSIDGDDVGPYPTDSIYSLELGGSAPLIMSGYAIGAAMLPFSPRSPDHVAAAGILPDDDGVGELSAGATLTFIEDDNRRRETGSIASIMVGFLAESTELTEYAGRQGRIHLEPPAHCPTRAIKRMKGARGQMDVETSVEFPFPPNTAGVEGGMRLPNSMGFIYEIEAVRRLIEAGEHIFPQWTSEESIGCLRTIESIRKQLAS